MEKKPIKKKPIKKVTKAEMELVLALQKRKLTTKELANVLKGLKSVNTKKYMPEKNEVKRILLHYKLLH